MDDPKTEGFGVLKQMARALDSNAVIPEQMRIDAARSILSQLHELEDCHKNDDAMLNECVQVCVPALICAATTELGDALIDILNECFNR